MNHYRNIGKLAAVHGLTGELLLVHHLGKQTALKGLRAIYLEAKKEELLPYFITSSVRKNGREIYLKLDGIDSRESARTLLQKQVWLSESDFTKYAAKSAPISLVGFTLVNRGAALGEIQEVIEQPHQVLCRLEVDKKEVLVPINRATLRKTDKQAKQVHVDLPAGLLELYLSNPNSP